MSDTREIATILRSIYYKGCEFPEWTIKKNMWHKHSFDKTVVYYESKDDIEEVNEVVIMREPTNIALSRMYDESRMGEEFGYNIGGYSLHKKGTIMPNIAVYCYATLVHPSTNEKQRLVNAHVINLIGYAFDSPNQPDYKYFNRKDRGRGSGHGNDSIIELIEHYERMWLKAYKCAKHLRKRGVAIDRIMIYNVGGGAFAGYHTPYFIKGIFEPAFNKVHEMFTKASIQVEGYDWSTHCFNGPRIPESLFEPETMASLDTTLYVNAWDPWSLIGNGNERDGSLDGCWGRWSNMAILGWPITNTKMNFVGI